jgi:ATP-dependent HslUV protease, peptidase subunit HslV
VLQLSLTKDWRTDKYLRRLEAMLAVISEDKALVISGNGDVIEPDDQIVAIGSGGMFALAAAKMLKKYSNFPQKKLLKKLENSIRYLYIHK